MMLKTNDTLRELRKQKGISQETLAEYLHISVQAISKWECGQSYPDITLLPPLAEYYNVSIDYLLLGEERKESKASEKEAVCYADFPDDDVLRVAQFRGKQLLRRDTYDADVRIPLSIDKQWNQTVINAEIWGSADIEGDITGNVSANQCVSCGDVGGNVSTNQCVSCGDVGGNVSTNQYVECGDVGGYIVAGQFVNCGDVGGSVKAGMDVECGDIQGDVELNGDLHCKEIQGDVTCQGDIYYET